MFCLEMQVIKLQLSSGAGGCDGGGVCAPDAGGVSPAGAADGQWQAAAGGAGGGAGLPGTGTQPRRPRHCGPPAAVHTPGAAPLLCECLNCCLNAGGIFSP